MIFVLVKKLFKYAIDTLANDVSFETVKFVSFFIGGHQRELI